MVPVRYIPLDKSEPWLNIAEDPDFFAEGLDTHWHDARHAVFYLSLDPSQRTTADWRTLGRQIVTKLLEDNAYIGLCFDGDPAFDDRVLQWLSAIREHTNQVRVEPGVVELKWITSPHATGRSSNLNTTWASLQATADAGWLHTFWDDLNSNAFNHGCDMILTAYREQVWAENPWDRPLTVAVFLSTIEHASAWLIPLTDDRGFLVGAIVGSPFHQRLSDGSL